MTRTVITTDKAPKAIGPYSVAIQTDGMVFCSGQVGLIPETGEMIAGGVEAEARQALINLTNVLSAAGSSSELVVKVTIFLKDMNDFAKVNTIYGEFFKDNYPARSTVAVAGLPKGALVEIEAIALRK